MKKNITIKDRLTVDYFDFDNSEWAMEYEDENGKIETIEDMVNYFNDVFDTPVQYLKELFEDEPFDCNISDDQENPVKYILDNFGSYLVESN